MAGEGRFVRAEDNDPAKAETWTLVDGNQRLMLGWRKGSRWVAMDVGESTHVFQMTREQMRQLAEIAEEI